MSQRRDVIRSGSTCSVTPAMWMSEVPVFQVQAGPPHRQDTLPSATRHIGAGHLVQSMVTWAENPRHLSQHPLDY